VIFNDTSSNKAGLIQDCEHLVYADDYGAISGNTNRLATFTNALNRGLEKVTVKIREAEGRWQWEDSNNTTDFPIATATLTANQQDYALDATSHFSIERVEVKDASGGWTKLTPFDKADVYDQPLSEFLSTAGVPQYYDKVGNSLFLYPKPSYTQVASLKLYFERGPSYFTTTENDKVPGFNPLFHRLLSLYASYDYASANTQVNKDDLAIKIALMESDLEMYYAKRDKDEHIRLTTRKSNYR
jgi:hypothetical protein